MCGRATLAMLVSSTSIKLASVTVSAMSQGLYLGFQIACSSRGTGRASIVAVLLAMEDTAPVPVHEELANAFLTSSLARCSAARSAQRTSRGEAGGPGFVPFRARSSPARAGQL